MKKRKYLWLCLPVLLAVVLCMLPSLPETAPETVLQTAPNVWETGDNGQSPLDEEVSDDAGDSEPEDPSTLIPSDGVPTINQQLTWEAINAFPIKSADMTIDEARTLCTDFLRFAKTALWTPKEDMHYIRNKSGTVDHMYRGIIYGGLPYVGVASGSVYRLMDFMDESTGEVDIAKALTDDNGLSGVVSMDRLKYFGNQCSIGAYWGWGRVINHAQYRWTHDMIHTKYFYRLGPYTYDDTKGNWSDDNTTISVCDANGEQILYQSYAQFQPADGMVHYTTGGHVIMCASQAHVEYLENGEIDGNNSFVTILDQAQTWKDRENESGDRFQAKTNIDTKKTFKELFDSSYVPFTFAEWLGTDPIEDTEIAFSHVGSSITRGELFGATVTCNYGISDIYAIVTDHTGCEVYRHAVRTPQAGAKSLPMVQSGKNVDTWGTLNSGTYNVEVVVQLATGERPTVYIGTLIA